MFRLLLMMFFIPLFSIQGHAFRFCAMTHDEVSGVANMDSQIEKIPACDYGKGAVWRIYYRKLVSEPTHVAALYCDFSKQILIADKLYDDGTGVVTCLVRNIP